MELRNWAGSPWAASIMRDSTKANSISGDELPGSSAEWALAEISVAKISDAFLGADKDASACCRRERGLPLDRTRRMLFASSQLAKFPARPPEPVRSHTLAASRPDHLCGL